MDQDITSAELDFFLEEPDRLAAYLALREQVRAMAEGLEVAVQKTTIAFRAPRPFLYVSRPFRKHNPGWPEGCLQISFSAPQAEGHPSIIHATPIRSELFTLHALVAPPGRLDEGLIQLVRQSLYMRNKRRQA